MRFTFAQAKLAMARFLTSTGQTNVGETINQACDELARTRTFQRMKKVIRITVDSEYFGLPQDCGSLLRAAVDATPVSIHGTEYEFLHSGPGDLDFQAAGLAPLNGIQRLGVFATMIDPSEALPLVAYTTTAAPATPLRVRGKNADGDIVVETVPVLVWTGPADAATIDVSAISTLTTNTFVEIHSITLPNDAAGYISLFAVGDELECLARMHPKVVVPEFTRYRLPGFSSDDGASYKVLAEVGARFMPMVDDDEIVPFDSLLPLQYMLQSMAAMEAQEVKMADDYRMRAEAVLIRREESELEKQGLVVINPLYDGSIGQASNEDYYNV